MILYTGWKETKNRRQEANMCQFLINTLEDDVFGLPLDHITGEAIAEGDPRSLKDLLEIFCEISEEFGRRSPLAGNSYMYINVWQLCVRYQTTPKHCGIIFQMATKYSGIKYQIRFCVRYKNAIIRSCIRYQITLESSCVRYYCAQKCVPVSDINWRLNVHVYEKLKWPETFLC